MSFGEIEIPYEWIVNQSLEDDAHEARLAHVVKASEANGATGEKGRVVDDKFVLFGGGWIFESTFLSYMSEC